MDTTATQNQTKGDKMEIKKPIQMYQEKSNFELHKKSKTRKDGSYIRFDDNAVVLLEKGKMDPKAGRVFGPIPRELAERGFQKIISLAPEVI